MRLCRTNEKANAWIMHQEFVYRDLFASMAHGQPFQCDKLMGQIAHVNDGDLILRSKTNSMNTFCQAHKQYTHLIWNSIQIKSFILCFSNINFLFIVKLFTLFFVYLPWLISWWTKNVCVCFFRFSSANILTSSSLHFENFSHWMCDDYSANSICTHIDRKPSEMAGSQAREQPQFFLFFFFIFIYIDTTKEKI